jgi:lincosamide nucleotidyltransferase A/C/D/E
VRILDWVTVKRRRVGVQAEDVRQALAVLEVEGLRCWLAGGWGIDALNGRQGRSHYDIDLILDRFEENEPRAVKALARLGYRMVEQRHVQGLWMPRGSVLDGGAGRNIDLLSLDLNLVCTALGLPEAEEGANLDALFTHGEISGRKVPCLTAPVQILFHAGYWARRCDRFDISRLVSRFPDALSVTEASAARFSRATAEVMQANLDYQPPTDAPLVHFDDRASP